MTVEALFASHQRTVGAVRLVHSRCMPASDVAVSAAGSLGVSGIAPGLVS